MIVLLLLMVAFLYSTALELWPPAALAQATYLNNSVEPNCIASRDLPVKQMIVYETSGTIGEGSVFLVADGIWVSADHVSPKDDTTNVIINSEGEEELLFVVARYEDLDIMVLEGNSTGLTPIPILHEGSFDFFTPVWNVGYPSENKGELFITEGTVIGHGNNKLFTDARVMGGMSGGLSFVCDEYNKPAAIGTISSYVYEQHELSSKVVSGIEIVELAIVNTGESFITPTSFVYSTVEELKNDTLISNRSH